MIERLYSVVDHTPCQCGGDERGECKEELHPGAAYEMVGFHDEWIELERIDHRERHGGHQYRLRERDLVDVRPVRGPLAPRPRREAYIVVCRTGAADLRQERIVVVCGQCSNAADIATELSQRAESLREEAPAARRDGAAAFERRVAEALAPDPRIKAAAPEIAQSIIAGHGVKYLVVTAPLAGCTALFGGGSE